MPMTINGSGTITGLTAGGLPDASVVQADLAAGVAGTGPAFRASATGTQALAHNTATKVQFSTETFDTNNCYDNTTNYRFTPTVAGYYQVNYNLDVSTTNTQQYYLQPSIYKNGSAYGDNEYAGTGNATGRIGGVMIDTVYLNGTTDYIEAYAYIYNYTVAAGGTIQADCKFSASMVRSA